MKNKVLVLMFAFILAISTACSNANNNNEEEQNNNENDMTNEENNEEENEENENNENNEDENEEIEASAGDVDFDTIIDQVEEATDGNATVVYEESSPETYEEDEYTITLDGYTFVELEDFHQDFSIILGDDDESGVIATHFTIENTSDEDIAYNPIIDLTYSGADRYPGESLDFTENDELISQKLRDDNFTIEAGEEVSGYYIFALHPEDIEGITSLGEGKLELPEAGDVYDADELGYKNKIGDKTDFTIVIDEDGAEKSSEKAEFYPDKVITDNMGDKKMIEENDDIGQSESLGNSTFTLEGYQFTDFEPNEVEAPRFENFDEGVVLLTVKFLVENGEDEELDLQQKGKLTLNDGKEYLLQEGLLSPHTGNAAVKPGDEEEMYMVFALEKEMYDKIWKDKSFELEVGPLLGLDTIDLSKGKKVEFDLSE